MKGQTIEAEGLTRLAGLKVIRSDNRKIFLNPSQTAAVGTVNSDFNLNKSELSLYPYSFFNRSALD